MLTGTLIPALLTLFPGRDPFGHAPELVRRTQPSDLRCGSKPRFIYFSETVQGNRCINRTRALHPSTLIDVYTPQAAEQYVEQHCPGSLEAFRILVPWAYKADLFRYCVLYAEGGIYLDDDLWLTKPWYSSAPGQVLLFEDLVLRDFKGRAYYRDAVWNGAIAACPGSAVLKCALDKATRNVLGRRQTHALALTGPIVLGSCVSPSSDAAFVGYLARRRLSVELMSWRGQIAEHVTVPRDPLAPHYSKFLNGVRVTMSVFKSPL